MADIKKNRIYKYHRSLSLARNRAIFSGDVFFHNCLKMTLMMNTPGRNGRIDPKGIDLPDIDPQREHVRKNELDSNTGHIL